MFRSWIPLLSNDRALLSRLKLCEKTTLLGLSTTGQISHIQKMADIGRLSPMKHESNNLTSDIGPCGERSRMIYANCT